MRLDIDHDGIFKMTREPFMWKLLMPAAIEVRAQAVAIAPIHKEKRKDRAPGTYKASLFRRQARGIGGMRVYIVGSTDRIANLVEWPSHQGRQKGKHVLLLAAQKSGLRTRG